MNSLRKLYNLGRDTKLIVAALYKVFSKRTLENASFVHQFKSLILVVVFAKGL